VEFLMTAILLIAFCLPAISVLVAASAWRASLSRPGLFVALGMASLYLFAGYLATRPIPTHAVMVRFDGSGTPAQDMIGPALGLALLTLVELAAASAVVLFVLRRLMWR